MKNKRTSMLAHIEGLVHNINAQRPATNHELTLRLHVINVARLGCERARHLQQRRSCKMRIERRPRVNRPGVRINTGLDPWVRANGRACCCWLRNAPTVQSHTKRDERWLRLKEYDKLCRDIVKIRIKCHQIVGWESTGTRLRFSDVP